MELVKINKRSYLINGDLKKMIPIKYETIINRLTLSDFNFDKVRLNNDERFKLELKNLVNTIKNNEPLVYELISDKKASNISFVECKFAENRNEVKIGNYWVKCSSELFNLAPKELRVNKFSTF